MLNKLRRENTVLGLFAGVGTVYGAVVGIIYAMAFELWLMGSSILQSINGFWIGPLMLLSIIPPALFVGLPVGCVVGILLGGFRATCVSWPIIGLLSGGFVSVLLFHFSVDVMEADAHNMTAWSIILTVLATTFTIIARIDYDSSRQRLPLMGKLKRAGAEEAASA